MTPRDSDTAQPSVLTMTLSGIAQIVFGRRPVTALLIILAVIGAALTDAAPPQAIAGLLAGAVIGTMTGAALKGRTPALAAGLYGFNPALAGLAAAMLLRMDTAGWVLAAIASGAAAILAIALHRLLSPLRLPVLTAPFVLATWAALLADRHLFAPHRTVAGPAAPLAGGLVDAVLRSLSQIFLIADPWAGILVLGALAALSRRAAVLGLGAALLSALAATALGLPADQIDAGLWGYSPVLTALALGTGLPLPGRPATRLAIALAGAVATIPVQMALGAAIAPAGVPVLTAPFVLTTWAALLLGRACR